MTPPTGKRGGIAPIGNRDPVVVSGGVDEVRQVVMSGTIGSGEATHDMGERSLGFRLRFRSTRLHPKVPHHHLLPRRMGPRRIRGIGRNVTLLDPSPPRTRA